MAVLTRNVRGSEFGRGSRIRPSRRHAITLLGAAGAVLTAGGPIAAALSRPTSAVAAQAVNCVVKPQMTQGPYYVDEGLNRSDIRTDPSDGSTVAGIKLTLNLSVLKVTSSCAPLQGATVDLWQCDAYGRYSDVAANNTVGKTYKFTSQLFFTEAFKAYNNGGSQMLLTPAAVSGGHTADFAVGLNL